MTLAEYAMQNHINSEINPIIHLNTHLTNNY